MVHIHAESKNFNASGDDANDIQVKLLFWFFIIFLDFNLFTIIGTSGRAWCRNEGKYGTATDIVFTPTKNIYDIVTSDLLISWQINCQTKVLSLEMV